MIEWLYILPAIIMGIIVGLIILILWFGGGNNRQ